MAGGSNPGEGAGMTCNQTTPLRPLTIQEAIDGLVASGQWRAAHVLVAERDRQAGVVKSGPSAPKASPEPSQPSVTPAQGDWWRGVRKYG